MRSFNETVAHCRGRNRDTIGICYEGGIIANGDPNNPNHAADTRTEEQKKAIAEVIVEVVFWNRKNEISGEIEIMGHRDESPDLDGDGVVKPWEWVKQCPCFEVKPEYETLVKVATMAANQPGGGPNEEPPG